MIGIRKAFVIFAVIYFANGLDADVGQDDSLGVTVEELFKLIRSRKATIIDVREAWELRQEGKIAGSINIPGWKLKSALSLPPTMFKLRYGIAKPPKTDCDVIFHCKSGVRSLKALRLARAMGWYCARHLLGGFNAWRDYFY